MRARLTQLDWGVLAAAVLPIIGFLPILRAGIVNTADGAIHVYRTLAMIQLMRDGNLWPRWVPYLHLGYGYPVFNFYPPGVYHLAAIMGLSGIAPPLAYNLIEALAWILGSTGVYILAKHWLPGRAALLAAILWAYAPIRMYEIWHLGSLPTNMAATFVPWVFWGLIKVSRQPNRRNMLALALPLVGMVICHQPVTLMTGIFLGPTVILVALWGIWRDREAALRRILYIAGSVLLAGGLAAVLLVPMVTQLGYVASSELASDVIPYLKSQYLQPQEIFSLFPPVDLTDMRFELPTSIGLVSGILALLGIFALARQKRYALAIALAAAVAFLAFMLTDASFEVWLRVPYLAQLRTALRFLSVGSLFTALAGGASLLLLPPRWRAAGLAVAFPIMLVAILPLSYANSSVIQWDTLNAQDEIEHELTHHVWGTTSYNEFEPIWGERVPFDPPAEPEAYVDAPMRIVVKELDLIKQFPDLKTEQIDESTVRVTVADARPVRFRQFYFPGWTVTIDGQPVEPYPDEEYGLITVNMPAGEHIVTLRYDGTAAHTAGILITLASIGVTAWLLYSTRSSKIGRQTPQPPSEGIHPRTSMIVIMGTIGFAVLNVAFIGPHTLWFREQSPPDDPAYMESAVNQSFGDAFELLGYTLDQDSTTPDGLLNITLFWRPQREITEEYRPVVQLVNLPATQAWASNEPLLLGNNKTIGYTPDRFVSDVHKLRIFDSAPPYIGRISVQLRDTTTGEFLRLPDGSDRVLLQPPIRILGEGQPSAHPLRFTLDNQIELWCASIQSDGDTLAIDLYWHVLESPERDLKVFIHGLDDAGGRVTQNDSPPLGDNYPTSLWLPGQNLAGHYSLPDAASVKTVAIGLYDPENDQRLAVTDNGQPLTDNRILLPAAEASCLP